MSDEEYSDDVYSLRDESDTLFALLALAVARFRADGFTEPVNAIELAYWLEGRNLNVFFVSDPDYPCYGQMPYTLGVSRRRTRVSYYTRFTVASWAFLFKLAVRDAPPEGPLLRVKDHDGAAVPLGAVRPVSQAVGRNLLRVATESYATLFAGITVTDPHWLTAFEDDDNDEWLLARVSRGQAVVYPREGVTLSREWFAKEAAANAPKGAKAKPARGAKGTRSSRPPRRRK